MRAALLEAILGRFLDGEPLLDPDSEETRVRSVVDSLTRLFNTRRGSVPHLPDYGLPDIGEVYQAIPDSLAAFKRILIETAKRYEPRIENVDCRVEQVSAEEFRLQAWLTARLREGGTVRLKAVFASAGRAQVAPAPRRG